MIEAEYIDDGRRVIIPSETWVALKDLAEHMAIYEIVEKRKGHPPVHSLDDLLAEEGLDRGELDG